MSSDSTPNIIHKPGFVAILVQIILLPAESLDSLMSHHDPENLPRTSLRISRANPPGRGERNAFVSFSSLAKLIFRA